MYRREKLVFIHQHVYNGAYMGSELRYTGVRMENDTTVAGPPCLKFGMVNRAPQPQRPSERYRMVLYEPDIKLRYTIDRVEAVGGMHSLVGRATGTKLRM